MQFLTGPESREAGLALAARIAFETTQNPSLRGQAAALLASIRAEAEGLNVITRGIGGGRPCTFLFVRESEDGLRKVALLPGAFRTYDAALRYWIVNGTNLLLPGMLADPWPDDVRDFIRSHTALVERKNPAIIFRWANAAYEHGQHVRDPRTDRGAAMALAGLFGRETVSVDEVESAISRIWFEAEQSQAYLERAGSNALLHRTALLVPIDVFRTRQRIRPMQALTWYLVEDQLGPRLTHAEAATVLGLGTSSQVSTHLKRVRDKTGGKGLPSIRPDPSLPPAPPRANLRFDITLHGEPSTISRTGGEVRKPTMAGKGGARPANGPSTTGNPSGGGRGNNPPRK